MGFIKNESGLDIVANVYVNKGDPVDQRGWVKIVNGHTEFWETTDYFGTFVHIKDKSHRYELFVPVSNTIEIREDNHFFLLREGSDAEPIELQPLNVACHNE